MSKLNHSKLNLKRKTSKSVYDSKVRPIKVKSATYKQKQLMKDLGIEFPSHIGIKRASELIAHELKKRSEPKSIHSNERDDRTSN